MFLDRVIICISLVIFLESGQIFLDRASLFLSAEIYFGKSDQISFADFWSPSRTIKSLIKIGVTRRLEISINEGDFARFNAKTESILS